MKKSKIITLLATSLFSTVAAVNAQTVDTFGWDDYANYSGTKDDGSSISGAPGAGHYYNPNLGDTTVTGATVTTMLSVDNGALSIPAPQNYVHPASFSGVFSPATADGLAFGDNHSNTIGSGLWHTTTLEFGQSLEMTGTQFIGFNGAAIDFGGFMIVHSGNTRTVNLALTGGAVFDHINLLGGYSDDYSIAGLGTANVTMTFLSVTTGVAVYNPEISGAFSALSFSQSDMADEMTTDEPIIYYRNNTASLVAVPEPSGVALMALAGAIATRRRRNQR